MAAAAPVAAQPTVDGLPYLVERLMRFLTALDQDVDITVRPKDAARAVHWFREAAKGGDVGAMYLLASMYEQGDGVERDLRLARYWYDVAARNGDEAAPDKVRQLDAALAAVPG